MKGERALDADAERLLANRERLARPCSLTLDADALEDLDSASLPLDHLEMHAHGVAGLEVRHLAQLTPLDRVDHVAHGGTRADAQLEMLAEADTVEWPVAEEDG